MEGSDSRLHIFKFWFKQIAYHRARTPGTEACRPGPEVQTSITICKKGFKWLFQNLLIYWGFYTKASPGFIEVSRWAAVVWIKASFYCEKLDEPVQHDGRAKVTQITTFFFKPCRTLSMNAQQVKPWSHSSKRTHQLDSRRLGKALPGLVNLDFGCNIQTVASEFAVNNMKACLHSACYQQLRPLLLVWGYFLGILWATY